MILRKLLLIVLFCSISGSVMAAELTRFNFNGKEIILFDDNTWRFAEPAKPTVSANCQTVKSEVVPISICLNPDIWTYASLGGDHEITLKLKDKELYLLVITEKDFIKFDDFKNAIITNAQNVSGLTKVQTLADESLMVDLHPFRRLVYDTKVDDLFWTFDNYYSNLKDKGSFQFVFFAGKDDFGNHRQAISDAINGVKVTR